jgi:serine/threonine-protein kinase
MSAAATVIPLRRAKTATTDPLGITGTLINSIYRVDELVGEGGFGVVYRACHLGLDQPIAIKFVRPDIPVASRSRVIRLLYAEARVLHDLSRATAGVVQALDASALVLPSGDWAHYLAMEWLDGRTLADEVLARRRSGEHRRTWASAIAWLEPALNAVSIAHDLGIAHRDLKPSNLMLTTVRGRSTLKVLDFGIAKVATPLNAFGRGETVRMFSPAYAAPEQLDPSLGPTGPWTDVYALGLILVELITGAPAYKSNTLDGIQIEATDRKRRPIPQASKTIRRVLEKALAVAPSERYANARELVAALRATEGAALVPRPRWPWLGFVVGALAAFGVIPQLTSAPTPQPFKPVVNDGTDSRRPALPKVEPPPTSAREFSQACWSHIHDKHWGWAKAECDEALRLDGPTRVRAETLHGLGLIARERGEIGEARARLSESLGLYEDSAARKELEDLRR